jgi:hypothetical protein
VGTASEPMTTLTAVRWKHPLWTIRRSACKSGCCEMFEAEQAEGSSERVVYRHTLGELDIRLDHLDRKGHGTDDETSGADFGPLAVW